MMKNLIFTVALVLGAVFVSNAQSISDNAIGLRLGDSDGFGTEINYQRGLSENNRLEFGLQFRSSRYADAFKLVGLYQWVWNINGGFNWYVGAGGGVASVSYDENFDNNTYIFAAGDIGVEYNFDFPLLLSLDFRPELGFGEVRYRDDLNFDIALGVRYQF